MSRPPPPQLPRYLPKEHRAWNRVTIESRLSMDVEVKELPGGEMLAFSSFRFRGSRRTADGGYRRFPSIRIAVMFVGDAARFAARGVRGQMVKATGRMMSLEVYGRDGRKSIMPRLIADFAELGQRYGLTEEQQATAGPLPVVEDADWEATLGMSKKVEEFE
jgi:single-stranded DNA-binding protein